MAQDFPVRDAGLAVCLASMSLACFATIAMALRFPHRPSWSIVAAAGSFLGYAFIALAIFYSSRTMLVAVAPEIALLLSALVALRLRSYLAPYPVKGA
jgi:hypothetical protein